MTREYEILGMTCNGCKTTVEKEIKKINGIRDIAIDLDTKNATITFSHPVDINDLKEALPVKYQISEKKQPPKENTTQNILKEGNNGKLMQLKPLFIILGYIITASILLSIHPWDEKEFILYYMGLFFIVFSFFKMLDLRGFVQSFRMYDPLAKKLKVYGWLYPFIEIVLGILFLKRLQISFAIWSTIIVLGITTIGVTRVLMNKKSIQCACLGTVLKLPMTEATLIENAMMLIMAVLVLFKYI